jgi:predicted transposase YbfD/YdcC
LCVDGKTARGTGRLKDTAREIPQLQTLHVYDNTNGICLVSKAINEKSNEIPTAQEVLKTMDLKNVIVTFDAMNTQRDTITVITEQKGLYLGALKANHQDFYRDVESYFTSARLSRIKQSKNNYLTYSEKAHNRIETRAYYFTKNVDLLLQTKEWSNIKSLIRYEKKSEHLVTSNKTSEVYYYISSLTNVEDCADAIRGHWGVENLLHWHLDTNFREDHCSIADRKAFQNFSLMNKLALSLLKLAAPILNISVRQTKNTAGWDTEHVLRVLCALDDDTIEKAMTGVDPNAGRKSRLKIPAEPIDY